METIGLIILIITISLLFIVSVRMILMSLNLGLKPLEIFCCKLGCHWFDEDDKCVTCKSKKIHNN